MYGGVLKHLKTITTTKVSGKLYSLNRHQQRIKVTYSLCFRMTFKPTPNHKDEVALDTILNNFSRIGERINVSYGEVIKGMKKIIDLENRLFWMYFQKTCVKEDMCYEYTPNYVLNKAGMITFFCNYHALTLTNSGFFGSARVLLRQSVESLILAKFSELDSDLRKKWERGEPVSLTREILTKLEQPKPEIEKLWKLLNQFTHATTYSQQLQGNSETVIAVLKARQFYQTDFNFLFAKTEHEREKAISEKREKLLTTCKNLLDEEGDSLFFNYGVLLAMLECNYHLLNSHLWNKAKGYIFDKYDPSGKKRVSDLKIETKREIKRVRQLLRPTKQYTRLVWEYKSTWELKHTKSEIKNLRKQKSFTNKRLNEATFSMFD